MELTIDPSERYLFVGKTGSGKTELAKYMLRIVAQSMPVVIVDPKEFWLGAKPKWAARKEPGTIDKPHLVSKFNPRFWVQCLQVDEDKEDKRLEAMCYAILKKKNWFIYLDETEDIATAHSVPRYIRRIWKTGRALNVGAWVSTQAPTGIPKMFKSQAEKFFAMRVGDEDVDTVASIVHAAKEEIRGLGEYEYMFYDNKKMDSAVWQPPVPFEKR